MLAMHGSRAGFFSISPMHKISLMKNISKTTVIVALTTLAIGLLLGWLLFERTAKTDTIEHDHLSMEVTESIWTCSMHPHIRKNEPGDCPICGMDLIPLASESGREIDPMAISMSPTAMQLAQVQTMVVGNGEDQKTILLNGKVQADERLVHTQSSHIPGRVEKLSVNFTGEYVSQGQVIAYIYSPDITTAQQELLEARRKSKKHNQHSSMPPKRNSKTGSLVISKSHRFLPQEKP